MHEFSIPGVAWGYEQHLVYTQLLCEKPNKYPNETALWSFDSSPILLRQSSKQEEQQEEQEQDNEQEEEEEEEERNKETKQAIKKQTKKEKNEQNRNFLVWFSWPCLRLAKFMK